MTVDQELTNADELLAEARRLLVEAKAEECLGLLDGALAGVEKAINRLVEPVGI
jgi:hypothetical protein